MSTAVRSMGNDVQNYVTVDQDPISLSHAEAARRCWEYVSTLTYLLDVVGREIQALQRHKPIKAKDLSDLTTVNSWRWT